MRDVTGPSQQAGQCQRRHHRPGPEAGFLHQLEKGVHLGRRGVWVAGALVATHADLQRSGTATHTGSFQLAGRRRQVLEPSEESTALCLDPPGFRVPGSGPVCLYPGPCPVAYHCPTDPEGGTRPGRKGQAASLGRTSPNKYWGWGAGSLPHLPFARCWGGQPRESQRRRRL